jgi:hypothetical protein
MKPESHSICRLNSAIYPHVPLQAPAIGHQCSVAKVPTQFVMLSPASRWVDYAKHLAGNQRPFAEFILRHEGLTG